MSGKSNNFKTYSRDEILEFSDKELSSAVHQMRAFIREARRRGEDTMPLEIEFCYLDNEKQKRDKWSSAKFSSRSTHNSGESVPVKPRLKNR